MFAEGERETRGERSLGIAILKDAKDGGPFETEDDFHSAESREECDRDEPVVTDRRSCEIGFREALELTGTRRRVKLRGMS